MNEHYRNIRDAVEQASKGEEPMTIGQLALAITTGLFMWGSPRTNLVELAKELAYLSGEPVDVYNKADEHNQR